MNFDIRRAHVSRSFNLRVVSINKQRDQDTRIRQALAGIAHFVELAGNVQTAFGGDFLTLLWHQAAEMRLGFAGDSQHLFGHRHFKVHAGVERLTQNTHIAVGDMTTVFT